MSTYPKPEDEIVADLLGQLDDELIREAFEERTAVFQFDAGMPRGHAECLAMLEVIRRYFILTKRG